MFSESHAPHDLHSSDTLHTIWVLCSIVPTWLHHHNTRYTHNDIFETDWMENAIGIAPRTECKHTQIMKAITV